MKIKIKLIHFTQKKYILDRGKWQLFDKSLLLKKFIVISSCVKLVYTLFFTLMSSYFLRVNLSYREYTCRIVNMTKSKYKLLEVE